MKPSPRLTASITDITLVSTFILDADLIYNHNRTDQHEPSKPPSLTDREIL